MEPIRAPDTAPRDPVTREFMLGEGSGSGAGPQSMQLGIGPQHPAMHGIIRIITELDGEVIRKADVEIGYLHRAFEKDCEVGGWNNAIPYTDRLNYVSPLINNFGYCSAVEKLHGIDVTERCQYIRVIMSEISRICDHLTCVGASAMELGAFTVFLYMIKAREYLWEVVEDVTGARLTISYGRIGGVKADLPEGFAEKTRRAFKETREVLAEVHRLLTGNRIFTDRMVGVGALSREETIAYGITGPMLRAVGVPFDVRKKTPYYVYDRLQWEVPLQQDGDNYARYLVRMAEMEQSMRIVEQALADIPGGPINVDAHGRAVDPASYVDRGKQGKTEGLLLLPITLSPNLQGQNRAQHAEVNAPDKRLVLPPKENTYGSIEGLMNHFMLIMDGWGIRPATGEAYFAVEGANGELGFYVVSAGTDRPYRVRCRPPCLPPLAALHRMIEGEMVADLIPTFGSVNMIGGELDR
ncbi:MAG: NADH-quinone oxidoreductase subunit D [Candidatus Rokubacteria bacterium]|nr:NADH-quinone oxidoreductase subunit D [Candidatus Rokubacteria bacterium]